MGDREEGPEMRQQRRLRKRRWSLRERYGKGIGWKIQSWQLGRRGDKYRYVKKSEGCARLIRSGMVVEISLSRFSFKGKS
jgi:hypothetical protein